MIALVYTTLSWAQFGPQQVIDATLDGAFQLAVIDVDGDTFVDVIAYSQNSEQVYWYKNLAGTGEFDTRELVGTLDSFVYLGVGDIDGDNDVDIVACAREMEIVVWYENLDGLGDFSAFRVIDNNFERPQTPQLGDLDGDNDLDVVVAANFEDTIYWFENLDGQGDFSGKKVVSTQGTDGREVRIADIDGDNDMDIVSTAIGGVFLTWYENLDGLGNFAAPAIIDDMGGSLRTIEVVDFDDDNDIDILGAGVSQDDISWYENLDGMGNFSSEIIVESDAQVWRVQPIDLDADDDMDILLSEALGEGVSWYENLDGMGDFGPKQVITTDVEGNTTAMGGDIDNDGDMDVFSISLNDDTLAWYENTTIFGVTEMAGSPWQLYPNPVQDAFWLSGGNEPITSLRIYDATGRIVIVQQNPSFPLDVSSLSVGLWWGHFETDEGIIPFKFIKK